MDNSLGGIDIIMRSLGSVMAAGSTLPGLEGWIQNYKFYLGIGRWTQDLLQKLVKVYIKTTKVDHRLNQEDLWSRLFPQVTTMALFSSRRSSQLVDPELQIPFGQEGWNQNCKCHLGRKGRYRTTIPSRH